MMEIIKLKVEREGGRGEVKEEERGSVKMV